jgi:hypothetical protein
VHLHQRIFIGPNITFAIQPMPLCRSCENFRVHSFEDDPDGLRGYRLQTVLDQALAGCEFCSLLRDGLDKESLVTDNDWLHLRLEKCKDTSKDRGFGASSLRTFVAPRFIEKLPPPAEPDLGLDQSGRFFGSLWTRKHANHDRPLVQPDIGIAADAGMNKAAQQPHAPF